MKTLLPLKIAAVLGYVALCTLLVLDAHKDEALPDAPMQHVGSDYE
jgi:hypothetical protein